MHGELVADANGTFSEISRNLLIFSFKAWNFTHCDSKEVGKCYQPHSISAEKWQNRKLPHQECLKDMSERWKYLDPYDRRRLYSRYSNWPNYICKGHSCHAKQQRWMANNPGEIEFAHFSWNQVYPSISFELNRFFREIKDISSIWQNFRETNL